MEEMENQDGGSSGGGSINIFTENDITDLQWSYSVKGGDSVGTQAAFMRRCWWSWNSNKRNNIKWNICKKVK